MPNWCYNKILILGKSSIIDDLERIKMDFYKIRPIPKELDTSQYKEKSIQFSKCYDERIDWLRRHWGAYGFQGYPTIKRESSEILSVEIVSAWSSPIEFFRYMTSIYDVGIILWFDEESPVSAILAMKKGVIEDHRDETSEMDIIFGMSNGRYEIVDEIQEELLKKLQNYRYTG